ncbi:hypothetical protein EYZ11_013529 [Aspergillus tanneri]|uniref:Uncharacterized protein n=1 Tax=Aspergillus tanneri TaxID=1220188 RepID=A0A4S3IXP3_9EURO|nr:hypothetical protein EYZ11_013529 [Aspergillus tanneri]
MSLKKMPDKAVYLCTELGHSYRTSFDERIARCRVRVWCVPSNHPVEWYLQGEMLP